MKLFKRYDFIDTLLHLYIVDPDWHLFEQKNLDVSS